MAMPQDAARCGRCAEKRIAAPVFSRVKTGTSHAELRGAIGFTDACTRPLRRNPCPFRGESARDGRADFRRGQANLMMRERRDPEWCFARLRWRCRKMPHYAGDAQERGLLHRFSRDENGTLSRGSWLHSRSHQCLSPPIRMPSCPVPRCMCGRWSTGLPARPDIPHDARRGRDVDGGRLRLLCRCRTMQPVPHDAEDAQKGGLLRRSCRSGNWLRARGT